MKERWDFSRMRVKPVPFRQKGKKSRWEGGTAQACRHRGSHSREYTGVGPRKGVGGGLANTSPVAGPIYKLYGHFKKKKEKKNLAMPCDTWDLSSPTRD